MTTTALTMPRFAPVNVGSLPAIDSMADDLSLQMSEGAGDDTGGLNSGQLEGSSPVGIPENGPQPSHDDIIRSRTTTYIKGFILTPKVRVINTHIFKTDPDMIRLKRYLKNNQNFEDLGRSIRTTSDLRIAMQAAIDASDSYEAGLAMGFLGRRSDIEMGSAEFQKGYRVGQAYIIKFEDAAFENKLFKAGFMATLAGGAILYNVVEYPDTIPQSVIKFISILWKTSLIYGFGTMLITGLFGSDGAVSRKLITSGPFYFHRNPYYASLGFTIASGGGTMALGDLASGSPHYAASAIVIAGVSAFLGAAHMKVLRDERVLEKTFGDKFREYKASTPRYFPAIWKIFTLF